MAGRGDLERLADGVLLPGFEGTRAPHWLLRRVEGGLGGVVLYARNVEDPGQVAALAGALAAERPELLVAIDEEGGDVTRLEAATGSSYPGNLALGVADDEALTRSVGLAMGAGLAAAGVNLNLAPVADVNANPDNPVIGVRSFGADPARVAAHTVAMVSGFQAAGVAACVKHFPGHGDTSVDSHLALPTAGGGRDGLEGALLPFRAAVEAGVQAVMTAHILVPALDEVPATISRRVLTGLLRQELGFDGLVVTDALEMRAIAGTVGMAEGAVRSVAAGADALCVGGEQADEAVVDMLAGALAGAVRSGRLAEERLAEAAGRVALVGKWAGAAPPPPPVEPAPAPPARASGIGLAAARRAVRADGAVRVGPGAVVVELQAGTSMAVGAVPWGVGDVLAGRDPAVEVVRVGEGEAGAVDPAAGRPLVVVVRDLHRHEWQAGLLGRLLGARGDLVVVEMGLPASRPEAHAGGAGAAGGYVATHGAGRVNALAAAEVLLGPERTLR
jgi:beta-N-acetylhexosaminidase